jgi:hypothetical protein
MAILSFTPYLDSAIIKKAFQETDAEILQAQHYLLGILPRVQEPEDRVRMMSGARQVINIMPQVARGNLPVKIANPQVNFQEIEMAHFWTEYEVNENDRRYLRKMLLASTNGSISNADEQSIISDFLVDRRAYNLAKYNKALLFMIGQLLTNPAGCVIDASIHNDAFSLHIDGINEKTATVANFVLNPYNVLRAFLDDAVAAGTRLTTILIGTEVADKFINSTYVTNLKQLLATTLFNYRPVNVDHEIPANGAYLLTNIGGVNIVVVNGNVGVNNIEVPVFDPRIIVGIKEGNLGTIHSAATERKINGIDSFDPSPVSFYEAPGGEYAEKITKFRSEGNYLISLESPDSIYRLTLTGW